MDFLNKLKDAVSEKVAAVPVIKVTMMGPRAVGKTSVMASIFSETRDSVAGSRLYFRPAQESAAELQDKRLKLMQIFEKKKDVYDEPQTGVIAASNVETTFGFEMGFAGRKKTVDIEIKDFPGEFLISKPSKVSEFIAESHIVIIAIDTPYLMEEGGRYNEEKNNVKQVSDFLTHHAESIQDKLILFVPLKSERYFHDDRMDEVRQAVEQAYAGLIDFCKTANIACVVSPIQTLGGVEFDRFVDNQRGGISKLSKFRFCGNEPRYQPLFCVQPMYYLLTYVANFYAWSVAHPKNVWERMKSSLVSTLKNNDEFFFEVKKISKNIMVDSMGYSVIVTNTILNIK